MYAVVDVETTGLTPSGGHRVIEIAVVHAGWWGEFQGQWSTLVNPGRNVTASHIHGVRAEHVADAPKFDQITGWLANLLAGRTLVAHNLPFDWSFIKAEYALAGLQAPELRGLDTMELAGRFNPSAPRSLQGAAGSFGIVPDGVAHTALSDARATARILNAILLSMRPTSPPWAEVVAGNQALRWPMRPGAPFQPKPRPSGCVPPAPGPNRISPPRVGQAVGHPPCPVGLNLSELADAMPRIDSEPMADPYLAVLDRCLADRQLSREEAGELAMLAHDLGLKPSAVTRLHKDYLLSLTRIALADDHLSADEEADLTLVARLLNLPSTAVQRAVDDVSRVRARRASVSRGLEVGDRVCFTGESEHQPKELWQGRALQVGLEVQQGVTKETTALVVAPGFANSGKARKARGYDIPVLSVAEFERHLLRLRSR